MPTKRQKLAPRRIGAHVSEDQRLQLEIGWSFWFVGSSDPPPFRDDAEMLHAWRLHGPRLMAEWTQAWTRPDAFWRFDAGVPWDVSPPELGRWAWPRGITSEAAMVRRLLRQRKLAPLSGEKGRPR